MTDKDKALEGLLDNQTPTHAKTRDGKIRKIASLEFASTDEGEGAVVLTFTDGTRALARECEPLRRQPLGGYRSPFDTLRENPFEDEAR
jgi:hypothetical protein